MGYACWLGEKIFIQTLLVGRKFFSSRSIILKCRTFPKQKYFKNTSFLCRHARTKNSKFRIQPSSTPNQEKSINPPWVGAGITPVDQPSRGCPQFSRKSVLARFTRRLTSPHHRRVCLCALPEPWLTRRKYGIFRAYFRGGGGGGLSIYATRAKFHLYSEAPRRFASRVRGPRYHPRDRRPSIIHRRCFDRKERTALVVALENSLNCYCVFPWSSFSVWIPITFEIIHISVEMVWKL